MPHHPRRPVSLLRLEDRIAPAVVIDRGDFYRAGGQIVPLLLRADQVAVRLPGAGDWHELTAPGRPLAGLSVVQPLGSEGAILEYAASPRPDPTEAVPAEQRPGVTAAFPVFQHAVSGGYVIPLDEVVVRLRPGITVDDFLRGDPRFTASRPLIGTADQFYLRIADATGGAALTVAERLSGDPRLLWASPALAIRSTLHTNDPLFPNQYHLQNTGQSGGTVGADVNAVGAWSLTTGSPNIVVAILDNAIQWTHPDLVDNAWVHPGEIAGNGIDDDGNGWTDDVTGWDVWNNDNNPEPDAGSSDNHGTACAGIAVARGDNGLGVAGIAYTSRLMPIRSNINPALSPPDVPTGIYYAAGRTADGLGTWRGADILSCSWGFDAPYQPINDAFAWASANGRGGKGLPIFVSTGNDSAATVGYPANLSAVYTSVMGIGATTRFDLRAGFSNYGPEQDFAVPGSAIATTDRTGAPGYSSGDYANSFSGTSAAAPLAAGIGALVLSRDPNLTAGQLRGLLRNTTDLIGNSAYGDDGRSTPYGFGRLDAAAAVSGVGIASAQVVIDRTVMANGASVATFTATTTAPQSRTFRVRNQGTQDLILGPPTVSGPGFTVSALTDSVLSVGEAATLTITFSPNTGGPFNATLSFFSNGFGQPSYSFALQGSATDVSPPRVQSVRVNDGSAQRSRVTSLTVTFDEPVTLPANPAAAFQLTGPGGNVAIAAAALTQNGRTSATISFSDANTESGSLADGLYTLTALSGSVTDGVGLNLDGNGDGAAGDNFTIQIHRLFGDANGDRTVNASDFLAFRLAFLTPEPAFDFDASGAVGASDFLAFRLRFLASV